MVRSPSRRWGTASSRDRCCPWPGPTGGFAEVVSLLRGADATFGNLETSIVDLTDTQAVPSGLPDDWATRAQPDTALDLRALGFDAFGRANNHATDWGIGGLVETGLWLDEAALVHAGAGATLAAARAPRYLETDQGRVGVVSMTTSPASGLAPALDAFGEVPARPGVHTVPVRTTVVVTRKVMRGLLAIHEAHPEGDVAWLAQHVDHAADPPAALELYGRRFELGREMGVRHEIDDDALAENLRAIRQASRHADVVVAAAHAHQGDGRPASRPSSCAHGRTRRSRRAPTSSPSAVPITSRPSSYIGASRCSTARATSCGATCRNRCSGTSTTRAVS